MYELDETEEYDTSFEQDVYKEFEEAVQRLIKLRRIVDNLRGSIEEDLLDLMCEILYDILDQTTCIESIRANFEKYARQYSETITKWVFLALRADVMDDYPLVQAHQTEYSDNSEGDVRLG